MQISPLTRGLLGATEVLPPKAARAATRQTWEAPVPSALRVSGRQPCNLREQLFPPFAQNGPSRGTPSHDLLKGKAYYIRIPVGECAPLPSTASS